MSTLAANAVVDTGIASFILIQIIKNPKPRVDNQPASFERVRLLVTPYRNFLVM